MCVCVCECVCVIAVYFLLFFVWGHTLCALSSLLSVFFESAQTATVSGTCGHHLHRHIHRHHHHHPLGYLLVFGSGMIGTTLILNFFESDTSDFTLFIIQLWPPFTFFRGLLDLSSGVTFGGTGLKLSDLADDDVYIDTVLIYLTLEWFFFMILTVYCMHCLIDTIIHLHLHLHLHHRDDCFLLCSG